MSEFNSINLTTKYSDTDKLHFL